MDKYYWMFAAILFFILMIPLGLLFDWVDKRFGDVGVLLAIICLLVIIIMSSVTFNLEISQMSDYTNQQWVHPDSTESKAREALYQRINSLDFVESMDAPKQGYVVFLDETINVRGKPAKMIGMRFKLASGSKAVTRKRMVELQDAVFDVLKEWGVRGDVMFTLKFESPDALPRGRRHPSSRDPVRGIIFTNVED